MTNFPKAEEAEEGEEGEEGEEECRRQLMSSVIQQNALGYIKIKLGRSPKPDKPQNTTCNTQYNMRHLSANDNNKMSLHDVAVAVRVANENEN